MKTVRALAIAATIATGSMLAAGSANAACVLGSSTSTTATYTGCDLTTFQAAVLDAALPGALVGHFVQIIGNFTSGFWSLAGQWDSATAYYFGATSYTFGDPAAVLSVVKSPDAAIDVDVTVPGPLAGAGLPFLVLGAAYLLRRRSAAAAV